MLHMNADRAAASEKGHSPATPRCFLLCCSHAGGGRGARSRVLNLAPATLFLCIAVFVLCVRVRVCCVVWCSFLPKKERPMQLADILF